VKIKLILGTLILLLSGQVNAAIIDNDYFTTDTNSGLDWLDVNNTFGLSYAQVKETAYFTADDFRHATVTEVVNIFSEFGVTNFSGHRVTENCSGVRNRIDTMGPGYNAGNFDVLEGWAELEPFDPNLAIHINVDATFEGNGFDNSRARMDSIVPKDFNHNSNHRGHWLVRETLSPVPVPAAIWLFGTGLLGLIGFRKRRKAA